MDRYFRKGQSPGDSCFHGCFFSRKLLRGTISDKLMEVRGKNRSVMPFDVLGRTRVTLIKSTSLEPSLRGVGNLFKLYRDGDR